MNNIPQESGQGSNAALFLKVCLPETRAPLPSRRSSDLQPALAEVDFEDGYPAILPKDVNHARVIRGFAADLHNRARRDENGLLFPLHGFDGNSSRCQTKCFPVQSGTSCLPEIVRAETDARNR